MKILLTGSSGQLGSELKRQLARKGYPTAAFDLPHLDITDGGKVLAAVEKERPDVIVNAAAYTNVDLAEKEKDRAFAVNAQGAGNVARAASRAGVPIIHISTDFVFDGGKSSPYAETDSANPLSVYGASKLKGEEEVAGGAPAHCIVRTSWLYGTEGANFVKTMLRLAAEKETVRVVYDQTGTPTSAQDLAGAVIKAGEAILSGSLAPGIYHYSNEGVASWYDFAFDVIEGTRSLGIALRCREVLPILSRDWPSAARRPGYSVLDKGKIKGALGITIPNWRASLKKTLSDLCGGAHG